jgi:hypothetical protein
MSATVRGLKPHQRKLGSIAIIITITIGYAALPHGSCLSNGRVNGVGRKETGKVHVERIAVVPVHGIETKFAHF